MTIIYALSGIALNHISDWNPSYSITNKDVEWEYGKKTDKATVLQFLELQGEESNYKKHYLPKEKSLKIFLKGGNIVIDLETGKGKLEKLTRRPIFYEVNFLHYNPKRLWTWFSDAFCVGLIIIGITGLFIIKGKKGITGRGAWLTGIGIVLPLILLMMYL
jgi:hypothetical protein